MEVVETVTELDGSVGWIVGNVGGMSRVARHPPQEVARTWFADQAFFVAGATGAVGSAIPVKGGYRVTGRWPSSSGIHHATRVMALCAAKERGSTNAGQQIACYLDMNNGNVPDAWHVSGLRVTGSCDFEVQDILVPEQHTHPFIDLSSTQPGFFHQIAPLSVYLLTVSVIRLGIARGAIRHFVALAGSRIWLRRSQVLVERETIQAEFGRAEMLHRSARALLVKAIEDLTTATAAGCDHLVEAGVMLRAACAHAAESAVRVVDNLAAAAEAAASFEDCGLERCVRDVHAAVKHVAMSPNNYILAGQVGMGFSPASTRY